MRRNNLRMQMELAMFYASYVIKVGMVGGRTAVSTTIPDLVFIYLLWERTDLYCRKLSVSLETYRATGIPVEWVWRKQIMAGSRRSKVRSNVNLRIIVFVSSKNRLSYHRDIICRCDPKTMKKGWPQIKRTTGHNAYQ